MTTLHALLEAQARRDPAAVAIAAPGRAPLSYGRLYAEVGRAVDALNALGIGQGDRVAVALENGPEMAVAFLGITATATCAALNPAYLEGELDFYLGDLGVKALVVQAGVPSAARAAARKRGVRVIELTREQATEEAGVFSLKGEGEGEGAPSAQGGFTGADSIALVLHTSGTTSRPKIVPLTQANLVAAAEAMARVLELVPRDRCLNIMPLFHIHGLSTLTSSLVAGASVVCAPAFDPRALLGWIEAFHPTWTTAAPTLYHALLEVAEEQPEVIARHRFRFLRSASSAMPPRLIDELERRFQVPFIEAYGMTEASPQIASNRLPPGKRKRGSVGPAAGPVVVILDEAGHELPAGQTGEVAIKGPSVMAGYENNPAASEAAFIHGFLRTGDQGTLDDEGYLFITGRLKEIINRGGEKIAPREVDEVLLDHPAVAQAVTFAVPHPRLGEDVAAAVVLRPSRTATPQEIQAFASARLAAFKVPRHVVFTAEIPKGATAKLKRAGLAEAFGLSSAALGEEAAPFAAPRTRTEEILAALWSSILKVAPVGVLDHFFRLGGDSLLASRLFSRIEEALHVSLRFQDLLLCPTVAALAQRVEALGRSPGAPEGQGSAPIPRLPEGVEAPLSFLQEALWFLDHLEPNSASYNIYRAAHLRGPLDATLLEQSIQAIVRRHDVLRTTFPTVDGLPRRVIAEERPAPLARVDLRALPADARQAEAERLAIEEAGRPFDLGRGPLLRTTLLALAADEHLLLFTAHHIVFDLWSVGVFFNELAAHYTAFARGEPAFVPALRLQHGDFAAWQRQQARHLSAQLAYWKEQLADLPPPLALPTDRPRVAARSLRGARRFFELPAGIARGLRALGQTDGVTLFMSLLTAFQVLLARVTGQRDIVVGSPIDNRRRAELEDLIGLFVNTLVFRLRLPGSPTFREVLGRTRAFALSAYAHPDLPFEQLVEALQPRDNRARMPIFQVSFRVQRDPVPPDLLPSLTLTFLKLSNQMAKFDLAIELAPAAEGLTGFIEYRTELFNPETIDRLLADLEALLAAVVDDPDVRVDTIALPSERAAREARRSAEDKPASPLPGPRRKSLRDARRKAIDLAPEGGSPEGAREEPARSDGDAPRDKA